MIKGKTNTHTHAYTRALAQTRTHLGKHTFGDKIPEEFILQASILTCSINDLVRKFYKCFKPGQILGIRCASHLLPTNQ